MKKYILYSVALNFILFSYSFAQLSRLSKVDIFVEVQQELFPVIAKFLSEGNINSDITGLVNWKIHNNSNDTIRLSVIFEIPEWTSPVITTIELNPNAYKDLMQTPFGIKLLSKHSTVPTTVILKAKNEDKTIFEETRNIKVRSTDEMIWSLKKLYDTESLIAAWVTPNDDIVEKILSNAKEKLFDKMLSGYQSADVISQVKAIFNAVRNAKVSYVSSTMSFGKIGFTQRVRLPKESILQKSANCIDGAVLFASLFENIGLQPLIVLVPSHAFVGVRLAPDSSESLFIETTMVGRNMMESIFTLTTTFDAAVKKGNEEFNNYMKNNPRELRIIDIKEARKKGIYPLW
jgi:hypothetical protein